jgi:hypothetical protein
MSKLSLALATSSLFLTQLPPGSYAELKPLLGLPKDIALQTDFSRPEPLKKDVWQQRQHTRWKIEDGVMRGIPSTKEYQASISHHRGLEPRISCPATPPEFVAKFSIRFIDGSETPIAPFVEFGHHIARVKFSESGISLIADGESVKLDEDRDFRYVPGKWYHALAELKGDEFVIQFEGGPTLYGKHPRFALPVSKGGAGFGVAGPRGGKVEIDNISLWTVHAKTNPGWAKSRAAIPSFKPTVLKAKN